jgi:hypothetical protein
MIFIQLCITFINLAPFIFLVYFVLAMILNQYLSNQHLQNNSNNYSIFNNLDSGIYG